MQKRLEVRKFLHHVGYERRYCKIKKTCLEIDRGNIENFAMTTSFLLHLIDVPITKTTETFIGKLFDT